jgi:hypothetical protein
VIYLALMFVSGAVAIAGALWAGDLWGAALAVGVLAACCLALGYGHDALPTRAAKRRREERAATQRAFEEASHAAYLEMVAAAQAGKAARRA